MKLGCIIVDTPLEGTYKRMLERAGYNERSFVTFDSANCMNVFIILKNISDEDKKAFRFSFLLYKIGKRAF